jgi:hypothetical protein
MNQPQPDPDQRSKNQAEGTPLPPWAAGSLGGAAHPAAAQPTSGALTAQRPIVGTAQAGVRTTPRLDGGSIFSVPPGQERSGSEDGIERSSGAAAVRSNGDAQKKPPYAAAAVGGLNDIRPLPSMSRGAAAPAAGAAAAAAAMAPPPNRANTGRLSFSMLTGVPPEQLQTGYLDPFDVWFPEPRSIAETGINQGLITDLVIKAMYYRSYMSGNDIGAELRLPFYGVLDHILSLMKREQLCEVSGTSGLGEASYQYILTIKGMERAHQVLARSSYVGSCPVPLAKYVEMVKMQGSHKANVFRDTVEAALRGMVVSEELRDAVGAAVNAGKSLFLFGAPGNGKTMLAERIAAMLGGHIAVPYALEADGQIIQLLELSSHRPVVPHGLSETVTVRAELADHRWVRVHRPVVMVGGELTMSSLDLIYNEISGFYEAPFQLKANGGLFLIDDFGRQQVSPQQLLNRWIVPLEKAIDFLTLKTGKKLQIPFDLFLVFSTNLNPEDLVDDAFLRRIQNKLSVPDPTAQQYLDIFVSQCMTMGVPFDQNGFNYLVKKHYIETGRPFRASHPRDLLRQMIGIARYKNVAPEMTPQLLDAACSTFFVNTRIKR